MSTLTKSRRMPTQYRLRAGGITEIYYDATPELVVVLPGTRWLEQRRERENRRTAELPKLVKAPVAEIPAPVIDTALTCVTSEAPRTESTTWTDRMRAATTRLVQRQAPWLLSLYGNDASFDINHLR